MLSHVRSVFPARDTSKILKVKNLAWLFADDWGNLSATGLPMHCSKCERRANGTMLTR